MQTFRIQCPVDAVFDDERTGNIQDVPAGSIIEVERDIAIALLLQADPMPRLLSPIKLRSGFLVHWLDGAGEPAEGRLMIECAFQREDGLEEWLLVEQHGTAQFITRGQLCGWDPAPLIEAMRQAYRGSSSDRMPLLAERCLLAILETPDEGPNYQRTA